MQFEKAPVLYYLRRSIMRTNDSRCTLLPSSVHEDGHLSWIKLASTQHSKFGKVLLLICNASMHVSIHIQFLGYEEKSQSKIIKCQICVQKRGVHIILLKGR
jgi:hypothetical protein